MNLNIKQKMNLFNSNIAAVSAFLAACLASFLFLQKGIKKDRRKLVFCIVGAIVGALALHLIFMFIDSTDKLPSQLWLMLVPVTASISAGVYIFIKAPNKNVSRKLFIPVIFLSLFASTAISFISINNYYHYYPTLDSLFGVTNSKSAQLSQQTTTVQLVNQKEITSQQTIEGSLYGQGDSSTEGTISSFSAPGTISHFHARDGFVYTPAIASTFAKVNLPVIVLTAGVPGSTPDWLNGGGLKNTMDAFAALHKGVAPYVFVVDNLGNGYNDTECVDSPRGNVETYLTQDVPNYIKSHFEVVSDPSGWAIGGLSLGGLCGIMLTLRHPNIYTTFMDLGGESSPEVGSEQQTARALFNGSMAALQDHQPLELLARQSYPKISGFFAIGKQDKKSLVTNMKTLFEASQKAKVQSIYEAIGGEHSFNVWAQGFHDALPWLSNRVGATACAGKCF